MSIPVGELAASLGHLAPVDLSHPLEPGMAAFPGHPCYRHDLVESYWRGDVFHHHALFLGEHTGTHLDAPVHLVPDGADILGAFPPGAALSRAAVLRAGADDRAGRSVSPDVLRAFESVHGPIGRADCVLIDCDWAGRWGTTSYMHAWPAVSVELTAALVERGVKLVAVDTPSPDASTGDDGFPVHRMLLGSGALIGENFARLDQVDGWVLLALAPLPIRDGSGSPVRATAYTASSPR